MYLRRRADAGLPRHSSQAVAGYVIVQRAAAGAFRVSEGPGAAAGPWDADLHGGGGGGGGGGLVDVWAGGGDPARAPLYWPQGAPAPAPAPGRF
jgi:hypothetical protein